MSPETESTQPPPQSTNPATELTERQEVDLADAATQERYRAEYLQQLRRMSCPGCGEGEANY